jgi:hypothetical protein
MKPHPDLELSPKWGFTLLLHKAPIPHQLGFFTTIISAL